MIEAAYYVATRVGLRFPSPRPAPRASNRAVRNTTPGRIKLVACVHSLALEGAPISLLDVLTGLIPFGRFEIHLISPTDGPLGTRARAAGISVHFVAAPQDYSAGRRTYEVGIADFARSLTSLQPDLVIANSIVTFHAVDAARAAGIPSMWIIRESDTPKGFFSLYPRAIQRRALACVEYPSRTVFVSQATRDRWPRSEPTRVLIRTELDRATMDQLLATWSRIDARRSLGLVDDEVMVLSVGTLCANKGQRDLVAAARMVARSAVPVRFVLVGASAEPGGRSVERAISRLPEAYQNRVYVHAATADIGRFYAAADIYVCSSRNESYPRSILEALAFGLPIVTTKVGGITEALGETEFRSFEPGDANALAATLRELVESSNQRSRLSESSRHRWAEMSKRNTMIESYIQQIDQILDVVH